MQILRQRSVIVDRLELVKPFGSFTKAQLREMARRADQVRVGAGEVLIAEGQRGREVFLILSGTAEVTQKGRPVNTLSPGDFFGELAALHCGPRNATVTALSDLEVLVVGPREFNAMLEIPGFRYALLTSMASRLRAVDARVADAPAASEAVRLDTCSD